HKQPFNVGLDEFNNWLQGREYTEKQFNEMKEILRQAPWPGIDIKTADANQTLLELIQGNLSNVIITYGNENAEEITKFLNSNGKEAVFLRGVSEGEDPEESRRNKALMEEALKGGKPGKIYVATPVFAKKYGFKGDYRLIIMHAQRWDTTDLSHALNRILRSHKKDEQGDKYFLYDSEEITPFINYVSDDIREIEKLQDPNIPADIAEYIRQFKRIEKQDLEQREPYAMLELVTDFRQLLLRSSAHEHAILNMFRNAYTTNFIYNLYNTAQNDEEKEALKEALFKDAVSGHAQQELNDRYLTSIEWFNAAHKASIEAVQIMLKDLLVLHRKKLDPETVKKIEEYLNFLEQRKNKTLNELHPVNNSPQEWKKAIREAGKEERVFTPEEYDAFYEGAAYLARWKMASDIKSVYENSYANVVEVSYLEDTVADALKGNGDLVKKGRLTPKGVQVVQLMEALQKLSPQLNQALAKLLKSNDVAQARQLLGAQARPQDIAFAALLAALGLVSHKEELQEQLKALHEDRRLFPTVVILSRLAEAQGKTEIVEALKYLVNQDLIQQEDGPGMPKLGMVDNWMSKLSPDAWVKDSPFVEAHGLDVNVSLALARFNIDSLKAVAAGTTLAPYEVLTALALSEAFDELAAQAQRHKDDQFKEQVESLKNIIERLKRQALDEEKADMLKDTPYNLDHPDTEANVPIVLQVLDALEKKYGFKAGELVDRKVLNTDSHDRIKNVLQQRKIMEVVRSLGSLSPALKSQLVKVFKGRDEMEQAKALMAAGITTPQEMQLAALLLKLRLVNKNSLLQEIEKARKVQSILPNVSAVYLAAQDKGRKAVVQALKPLYDAVHAAETPLEISATGETTFTGAVFAGIVNVFEQLSLEDLRAIAGKGLNSLNPYEVLTALGIPEFLEDILTKAQGQEQEIREQMVRLAEDMRQQLEALKLQSLAYEAAQIISKGRRYTQRISDDRRLQILLDAVTSLEQKYKVELTYTAANEYEGADLRLVNPDAARMVEETLEQMNAAAKKDQKSWWNTARKKTAKVAGIAAMMFMFHFGHNADAHNNRGDHGTGGMPAPTSPVTTPPAPFTLPAVPAPGPNPDPMPAPGGGGAGGGKASGGNAPVVVEQVGEHRGLALRIDAPAKATQVRDGKDRIKTTFASKRGESPGITSSVASSPKRSDRGNAIQGTKAGQVVSSTAVAAKRSPNSEVAVREVSASFVSPEAQEGVETHSNASVQEVDVPEGTGSDRTRDRSRAADDDRSTNVVLDNGNSASNHTPGLRRANDGISAQGVSTTEAESLPSVQGGQTMEVGNIRSEGGDVGATYTGIRKYMSLAGTLSLAGIAYLAIGARSLSSRIGIRTSHKSQGSRSVPNGRHKEPKSAAVQEVSVPSVDGPNQNRVKTDGRVRASFQYINNLLSRIKALTSVTFFISFVEILTTFIQRKGGTTWSPNNSNSNTSSTSPTSTLKSPQPATPATGPTSTSSSTIKALFTKGTVSTAPGTLLVPAIAALSLILLTPATAAAALPGIAPVMSFVSAYIVPYLIVSAVLSLFILLFWDHTEHIIRRAWQVLMAWFNPDGIQAVSAAPHNVVTNQTTTAKAKPLSHYIHLGIFGVAGGVVLLWSIGGLPWLTPLFFPIVDSAIHNITPYLTALFKDVPADSVLGWVKTAFDAFKLSNDIPDLVVKLAITFALSIESVLVKNFPNLKNIFKKEKDKEKDVVSKQSLGVLLWDTLNFAALLYLVFSGIHIIEKGAINSALGHIIQWNIYEAWNVLKNIFSNGFDRQTVFELIMVGMFFKVFYFGTGIVKKLFQGEEYLLKVNAHGKSRRNTVIQDMRAIFTAYFGPEAVGQFNEIIAGVPTSRAGNKQIARAYLILLKNLKGIHDLYTRNDHTRPEFVQEFYAALSKQGTMVKFFKGIPFLVMFVGLAVGMVHNYWIMLYAGLMMKLVFGGFAEESRKLFKSVFGVYRIKALQNLSPKWRTIIGVPFAPLVFAAGVGAFLWSMLEKFLLPVALYISQRDFEAWHKPDIGVPADKQEEARDKTKKEIMTVLAYLKNPNALTGLEPLKLRYAAATFDFSIRWNFLYSFGYFLLFRLFMYVVSHITPGIVGAIEQIPSFKHILTNEQVIWGWLGPVLERVLPLDWVTDAKHLFKFTGSEILRLHLLGFLLHPWAAIKVVLDKFLDFNAAKAFAGLYVNPQLGYKKYGVPTLEADQLIDRLFSDSGSIKPEEKENIKKQLEQAHQSGRLRFKSPLSRVLLTEHFGLIMEGQNFDAVRQRDSLLSLTKRTLRKTLLAVLSGIIVLTLPVVPYFIFVGSNKYAFRNQFFSLLTQQQMRQYHSIVGLMTVNAEIAAGVGIGEKLEGLPKVLVHLAEGASAPNGYHGSALNIAESFLKLFGIDPKNDVPHVQNWVASTFGFKGDLRSWAEYLTVKNAYGETIAAKDLKGLPPEVAKHIDKHGEFPDYELFDQWYQEAKDKKNGKARMTETLNWLRDNLGEANFDITKYAGLKDNAALTAKLKEDGVVAALLVKKINESNAPGIVTARTEKDPQGNGPVIKIDIIRLGPKGQSAIKIEQGDGKAIEINAEGEVVPAADDIKADLVPQSTAKPSGPRIILTTSAESLIGGPLNMSKLHEALAKELKREANSVLVFGIQEEANKASAQDRPEGNVGALMNALNQRYGNVTTLYKNNEELFGPVITLEDFQKALADGRLTTQEIQALPKAFIEFLEKKAGYKPEDTGRVITIDEMAAIADREKVLASRSKEFWTVFHVDVDEVIKNGNVSVQDLRIQAAQWLNDGRDRKGKAVRIQIAQYGEHSLSGDLLTVSLAKLFEDPLPSPPHKGEGTLGERTLHKGEGRYLDDINALFAAKAEEYKDGHYFADPVKARSLKEQAMPPEQPTEKQRVTVKNFAEILSRDKAAMEQKQARTAAQTLAALTNIPGQWKTLDELLRPQQHGERYSKDLHGKAYEALGAALKDATGHAPRTSEEFAQAMEFVARKLMGRHDEVPFKDIIDHLAKEMQQAQDREKANRARNEEIRKLEGKDPTEIAKIKEDLRKKHEDDLRAHVFERNYAYEREKQFISFAHPEPSSSGWRGTVTGWLRNTQQARLKQDWEDKADLAQHLTMSKGVFAQDLKYKIAKDDIIRIGRELGPQWFKAEYAGDDPALTGKNYARAIALVKKDQEIIGLRLHTLQSSRDKAYDDVRVQMAEEQKKIIEWNYQKDIVQKAEVKAGLEQQILSAQQAIEGLRKKLIEIDLNRFEEENSGAQRNRFAQEDAQEELKKQREKPMEERRKALLDGIGKTNANLKAAADLKVHQTVLELEDLAKASEKTREVKELLAKAAQLMAEGYLGQGEAGLAQAREHVKAITTSAVLAYAKGGQTPQVEQLTQALASLNIAAVNKNIRDDEVKRLSAKLHMSPEEMAKIVTLKKVLRYLNGYDEDGQHHKGRIEIADGMDILTHDPAQLDQLIAGKEAKIQIETIELHKARAAKDDQKVKQVQENIKTLNQLVEMLKEKRDALTAITRLSDQPIHDLSRSMEGEINLVLRERQIQVRQAYARFW
ncbi:MAG: hypothetical protein HY591_04675, partial [Candidatus Omnitrophica bacterium]|nr:hypothetical protein [Candidatus Omnitrophota bacterium]